MARTKASIFGEMADTAWADNPLIDDTTLIIGGPDQFGAGGPAGTEPLVLALEDLVPDEQGEVVLVNDAATSVQIVTGQQVVATGSAEDHVTAAGYDVSGLQYYSLDTGVTVYYPADMTLVIGP